MAGEDMSGVRPLNNPFVYRWRPANESARPLSTPHAFFGRGRGQTPVMFRLALSRARCDAASIAAQRTSHATAASFTSRFKR
jgi:hypothetical protein